MMINTFVQAFPRLSRLIYLFSVVICDLSESHLVDINHRDSRETEIVKSHVNIQRNVSGI